MAIVVPEVLQQQLIPELRSEEMVSLQQVKTVMMEIQQMEMVAAQHVQSKMDFTAQELQVFARQTAEMVSEQDLKHVTMESMMD